MNLFKVMETTDTYDYMAFVTNDMESALHIHSKSNQRGDCENRIRELKYDYAIDGFCLQHFGAMEAVFRLIMVAYNLMQIFKQAVMTSDRLSYQRTIRFQCIAIGSYLVRRGRKTIMKLSAEGKRRHFLDHLFTRVSEKGPPYTFSIA